MGDNLFANSIIALSAETGNKIWHFQTVHHDVWDRDLPAPPILFDYSMNDSIIPSLAQVTKSGYIYLLNRITGKPLYKIIERPVPSKSNLEGEVLSKTQPIPTFPDPFSRQSLTKNDIKIIAELQLKELRTRLNEMNINLSWDENVVNLITLEGYNPEYGARPIKRTIRYLIEDKISDLILKEELEKKVITLKEIDGYIELKVD